MLQEPLLISPVEKPQRPGLRLVEPVSGPTRRMRLLVIDFETFARVFNSGLAENASTRSAQYWITVDDRRVSAIGEFVEP